MAMMRYEPVSAITRLQREINRVFGNHNDAESSGATADWMPAVDIREFADRFELLIDLPGVEPKKVEITLDKGVLTLTGERRDETIADAQNGEGPQQQRSERLLGRFHRRFILPDTVDSEKVKANGSDGVLEISIAKQAKSQPRRITVNSWSACARRRGSLSTVMSAPRARFVYLKCSTRSQIPTRASSSCYRGEKSKRTGPRLTPSAHDRYWHGGSEAV